MKELLVVIPVYKEKKPIGKVIDDLKKHMGFADKIFVDDCLSDITKDIVKHNLWEWSHQHLNSKMKSNKDKFYNDIMRLLYFRTVFGQL